MGVEPQVGWISLLSDTPESNWGSVEAFSRKVLDGKRANPIKIKARVWGKLLRSEPRPKRGDGIAFYHSTRAGFPDGDPYKKRPRISLIATLDAVELEGQEVRYIEFSFDRAMAQALRKHPIVRDESTRHIFARCGIRPGPIASYYFADPKAWAEIVSLSEARRDGEHVPGAKTPGGGIYPEWTRDELILLLDLYFRVDGSRISEKSPEIIALSELLNDLPVHDRVSTGTRFRSRSDVQMKLREFLRFDPRYAGDHSSRGPRGFGLEAEVWNHFAAERSKLRATAAAIRDNYKRLAPPDSAATVDADEEFSEGRILAKLHKIRERDPTLAKKKKAQVLRQEGRLECEACRFDFRATYGELGSGFAECHHTVPISAMKPDHRTKLSELAILCANCHRMVHRGQEWLSVEKLRQIILASQS